MGAYRLTKEWQEVTERDGVIQNTCEQNIEFIIVDEGVEPLKGGGKIIKPRGKDFFELRESEKLYVRAFEVFAGIGFVPTVSVDSIVDYLNREQEPNPLEGTTNSLTIGLSIWSPRTSYYPEDWCVIAKDLLWKCTQAHDNDSDFDADVERGYWQNVICAINSIEIDGTDIVLTDTRDEETRIPITALSAVQDADGNNIAETYATKSELASVEDSLVRSVAKKDDTTIIVAMGDDETETDIQLGSQTYATKTELSGEVNALNGTITNTIAPYLFLIRQPSTSYSVGDTKFTESLQVSYKLECTTAGTTSAQTLVVPSGATTVTDGTCVWDVTVIGSGSGGGSLWIYDDNSSSLHPKDIEDLTAEDLETDEATLRAIVADVVDEKLEYVPIGIVLPFMGNGAIPSGYLLCDGSAVSRTMYPDLFTAIGTTYGSGDGSTTFNLPDSNQAKRFLQGDTVAGIEKQAGLPNITGTFAQTSTTNKVNELINNTTGAFTYDSSIGGDSYVGGTAKIELQKTTFSAQDSNSIYGNSTTVQPNALTTRYIIKAFDGQTADSALIDITQYANELVGKADRSLSNLTQAGQDSFLERDFTIIYPNGGTEGSPATVSNNSRYVESNPFTGYYVNCEVEIKYNNTWSVPGWFNTTTSNQVGYATGVKASQYNDDSIVIQTGNNNYLLAPSSVSGSAWGVTSNQNPPLPCRVKVWKIGKIPT